MAMQMSFYTAPIHAGTELNDDFEPVNLPIYLTSNYRLPADGVKPVIEERVPVSYSRKGNVNEYDLEDRLCALTEAEDSIVFASGVAALSAVFITFLNSGDHVICSQTCYNATFALLNKYLPEKFNIEVDMVDTSDTDAVAKAIRTNTKLIHVECPGNPTTIISDIRSISAIAKKAGALLSVDATYAGPICLHPLKLGADLEVYSMTKYINGHGDALGGCVLGRRELTSKLREVSLINFGGNLSPFNAWLISRGLMTLPLRMAQHCKTAMKIAEFLESSPAVRFVYYPGLESHPQHSRAEELMENGYSAMMAFDIYGTEEQHLKFMENLKLFVHAVSLGDITSLILYNNRDNEYMPYYPEVFRQGFYRISVGIEDADDLINDIKNAFLLTGLV